jgi:hypothetical protein
MFKTSAPVAEPAPDVVGTAVPTDLIPLSHLELDLPAPTLGWLIELDRRGIPIVLDDLGRKAISRDDARTLLAERSEAEARRRAKLAENEQRAVEADRLRRASIWRGLPADHLPVGVTASDAMVAAIRDAQPKRTSPLQEVLAGESLVYHSYGPSPEDESA